MSKKSWSLAMRHASFWYLFLSPRYQFCRGTIMLKKPFLRRDFSGRRLAGGELRFIPERWRVLQVYIFFRKSSQSSNQDPAWISPTLVPTKRSAPAFRFPQWHGSVRLPIGVGLKVELHLEAKPCHEFLSPHSSPSCKLQQELRKSRI